jgi:hypothetical protein
MNSFRSLVALTAFAVSLPVLATPVTTVFDNPTATGYNPYTTSMSSTNINNDYGNAMSFGSGGNAVSVTAFADTASGGKIESAITTMYNVNGGTAASSGNSLAVTSRNTTSGGNWVNHEQSCNGNSCTDYTTGNDPEHAMDNNGAFETLLLSFQAATRLTGLTIGFPGGSSPDSDMSVLYYKGTGTPVLLGQTYANLVSSGLWGVVNDPSLLNVGASNSNSASFSATAQYFLVGAYITGLAGQQSAGDTNPDYVKLRSITTDAVGRVPEPTSIALFGIAGAGLFASRRRRVKVA